MIAEILTTAVLTLPSTEPETPPVFPLDSQIHGDAIKRADATPNQKRKRLRARVVRYAKRYLGVPYVFGGSSPVGFDCSGLTMYVYRHFGRYLPHSSYSQEYYGRPVGIHSLRRGDLVFSYAGGHVSLYSGHGRVIVAPHSGSRVKIQSLVWLPVSAARRLIHG